MSPKYESLLSKWNLGYITKTTLQGWVEVNKTKPDKGITAEEYEMITGETYPDSE